jgi:hypothetical protein
MKADYQIPEPILFNLLKHHIGFIKEFMMDCPPAALKYQSGTGCPPAPLKGGVINNSLRRIGTTVMDIYTGTLTVSQICEEITEYLQVHNLSDIEKYSVWTGTNPENFRIISLSDDSHWTMKFQNDPRRYVHIFPSRNSKYTFRVKGNTLKSALIYQILIGKDMVTSEDLNKVRPLLGLSPVKSTADAAAIVELIELLRE